MVSKNRIILSCAYWAFVLYIFIPLILMIVMGFKDSKFIGFPIKSWTFNWYISIFSDYEIIYSFGYSIVIAIVSTLISILIGTWIAVLLEGRKFWGWSPVFGLMILPALVPGIISAIAFRIYARWLGIEPGMGAIIWAHAVHNVPFVTIVVMARLSTLPKSQIEAARDLGADPLLTFIRITFPYIIPAILGASIFCLLLSFDDFVRSFFLGDYNATLPVLIFAMLRSGMSPEINAIATIALILTAAIGVWAERFTRKTNKDNSI